MRDLSQHLLDIAQNSVSALAKNITITLNVTNEGFLEFIVDDNGSGMEKDYAQKVSDPFVTSRTTRKVGLGLPMLKDSANRCNGNFEISSVKHKGTKVFASFEINNIDRIPLGDISESMRILIASNTTINFKLILSGSKGIFIVDTDELNKTLNGVPINEITVLDWIKAYIDEGIKNIFGGVLNEVDC